MMKPEIFKAYDVRGIYPEELDEETAWRIGLALGELLGGNIGVGRDVRRSSPSLQEALVRGLVEGGAEAMDMGVVTTPMTYVAGAARGWDGSVMVTASHNPPQYNGFKICRQRAIPIYDQELQELARRARRAAPRGHPGRRRRVEVLEEYRERVRRGFRPLAGMRVVVDTGNGVVGCVFEAVFEGMGLRLTPLYFEPDGSFPHHVPDPLKPENTRDLERLVRERGADLGLAYDGDGDRIIFVDERGQRVRADLVTALIATEVLRRHPGATVVYDVRSSRAVREAIEEAGGRARLCRVGHAFMKEAMRAEDAVFGGELSGHYYFRDAFYTDNADMAVLWVLRLMQERERPLSELIRPFERYVASGEINAEVADKEAKLRQIEALYADGRISHVDGLTVEYDDWWFNLRPSNTEPLLRLNLEAKTPQQMERHRDRLLEQIRDP